MRFSRPPRGDRDKIAKLLLFAIWKSNDRCFSYIGLEISWEFIVSFTFVARVWIQGSDYIKAKRYSSKFIFFNTVCVIRIDSSILTEKNWKSLETRD